MAFTIPNEVDAGPYIVDGSSIQAQPDSEDFAALTQGIRGRGVVTGLDVTAGGGLNLDVAAGTFTVGGGLVIAGAITVAAPAADPNFFRFDIVVINSVGTVSVVAGTASATRPDFPAVPANSLFLGAVTRPPNDNTISADQIIEKQVMVTGQVLADGSIPLTAPWVVGNNLIFANDIRAIFGTLSEADIRYDGSDLIIRPAVVGTGDVLITGGGLMIEVGERLHLGHPPNNCVQLWTDPLSFNLFIDPNVGCAGAHTEIRTGDLILTTGALQFGGVGGQILDDSGDIRISFTDAGIETLSLSGGQLVVTNANIQVDTGSWVGIGAASGSITFRAAAPNLLIAGAEVRWTDPVIFDLNTVNILTLRSTLLDFAVPVEMNDNSITGIENLRYQDEDGTIGVIGDGIAFKNLLDKTAAETVTGPWIFNGAVVINEAGADVDFRVEGLNDTSLFHVDASADRIGVNIASPARTMDIRGEFFIFGQQIGVETMAVRSRANQTARTFVVENHAGADYFAVFSPSLPITDITTSILTTLATMTFGANNIAYRIFDVGQTVNVDTYTGHGIIGMNFSLTLAGSTGTVSTIENIRVGLNFGGIDVTTSAAYIAAAAPSTDPAAGSGTFYGFFLPDMSHANWANAYPIYISNQTLAGTNTIPIYQVGPNGHNRLGSPTLIGADAAPESGYGLELRNDFLLGAFFQELREMTAPGAGGATSCRVYAEDDGAGKTRLMALFGTGVAQQIAIEP